MAQINRQDLGPVSAYAEAVAQGFTGTIEEWYAYIAGASTAAQTAVQNAESAAESAETSTIKAAEAEAAAATASAAYNATLVAKNYSAETTYPEGAYVIYGGGLYRCKAAITTAEAWTAAHWAAVSAADDVQALQFADKVWDSLTNDGQYIITSADLESGSWGYANKTASTKRLRTASLLPVRKGMTIRYTNASQKVYFGILETRTSASYLYTTGWIETSSDERTLNIGYDGFLTFIAEGADGIKPEDYTATVKLTSTLAKDAIKMKYVLASGADLNDTRENGVYYLTYSGVYTNRPEESPGILVVIGNVTDYAKQTFTVNGGKTYERSIKNGAWSEWRQTAEVQETLAPTANLYGITKTGTYVFYGTNVSTMTGLPDGYAGPGVLRVLGTASVGRTVQLLFSYTNKVYTRYHNDDYDPEDLTVGWTEWTRADAFVQYDRALGLGDNIDEITNPGAYYGYGVSLPNIGGTFPAGWGSAPFTLLYFKSADSGTSAVQIMTGAGQKAYIRYHDSQAWLAWRRFDNRRETLEADTDVNRITEAGEYSFTMGTSQTLTGMPENFGAAPGVLQVISGTLSPGRTVQIIYNGLRNTQWTRYHNDDYSADDSSVGWTEWKSQDEISFDAKKYQKQSVANGLKPLGLMSIYVTGDMTGISHEDAVNITWHYETNYVYEDPETHVKSYRRGKTVSDEYTGTLKWQGRGSLSFPKKNFTLKSDTKVDMGWGEQKKHVLKGNWLDPSMANNLTGAKLWGQLSADHSATYPAQMVSSPNYCAVDGYPVMLFINGEYVGVYNLNIPKDKWMAGMSLDEGTTECIICSDASTATCGWDALAETLDDLQTGWCLEELSDGIDAGVALRALNQAISAVMNAYSSRDSNWEATVGQYIDIDSAIDYLILRCLIDDRDGQRNNQLLVTYNLADPQTTPATPTKWYFVPYDMDMTFGAVNQYYGADYINKIGDTRFEVYAANNRLFWLIWNYSRNRLKARYTALRNYHLSYRNVYHVHGNITAQIPAGLYQQEHILWPLTPCDSIMSTVQAMMHYRINCEMCDKTLYDESLLS